MTIVVSDTGPLNYLIQIGCVHVIRRLFTSVIVPPAVIEELSHARAPQLVRGWTASLPEWIQVTSPQVARSIPSIGKGEAQALSVAQELHAKPHLAG